MSGQPTPGPWSIYVGKDGKTVQVEPGNKAHGVRPAIVFWTGFDANDMLPEVNVANARLIAAAPTMAAELKHAARMLAYASDYCRTIGIEGDRFDLLAEAERIDGIVAAATGGPRS